VAATATDAQGNTSEFSTMVEVTPSPAAADLGISIDVNPAVVNPGGDVTYTITVRNNGPDKAENVAVGTAVPSGSTFVSLVAPAGWATTAPSVGAAANVSASIASLDSGASAVFSLVVRANVNTPSGATLTAIASVSSDTIDSNLANNQAEASAAVMEAPSASATVAISGNINPATVGQAVTYTVTASNTSGQTATGVVVHVFVPSAGTIVSLGGGSQSASGVDFNVGTLGAGASHQFQMVVRPEQTGTLTLTASLSADPGVTLGPPASVTTAVVASNPGVPTPPPTVPGEPTPPPVPGEPTPPTVPGGPTPTPEPGQRAPLAVKSAKRFGFHEQPTVLVVTFNEDWHSDARSNPGSYMVLVSANGAHRAVPIKRVYYDAGAHRATLLVSRKVYLYRPWQLLVGEQLTQAGSHARGGDVASTSGQTLVTRMSMRDLAGRASHAPGAAHIGIKAVPSGPLAARASHGWRAHK
jgi:uncharacterized repeat protein (TIGR01451 family)